MELLGRSLGCQVDKQVRKSFIYVLFLLLAGVFMKMTGCLSLSVLY
jgi:hypothetical protein